VNFVVRMKRNAMTDLMTTEEFVQFERKWKIVFTVFGIVFAGAILDYLLRSPRGAEAFLCYSLGPIAFLVCVLSARKLADADRLDRVMGGLEVLGEDLSSGDLDD